MATPQQLDAHYGTNWLQNWQFDPVVDCAGQTIVLTVRTEYSPAGVVLLTATTDLTAPTLGQFSTTIPLGAWQESVLPDGDPLYVGSYVFELRRTDAGLEDLLAYGPFVVKP